jgi:DNA-binding transcriptional ArsR family regulator
VNAESAAGIIATTEQIEALSNPLRIRILHLASRPVAVSELADRLGVPATRLYYHVNLLVEERFLAQVDQRKSGARIEKIYQRTASNLQLGPDVVETIGDRRKAAEAAAGLLFDPARVEVADTIEEIFGGAKPTAQFGRMVVRLAPADAERFEEKLEQLMSELGATSSDESTETYSCTMAFVPIGSGSVGR